MRSRVGRWSACARRHQVFVLWRDERQRNTPPGGPATRECSRGACSKASLGHRGCEPESSQFIEALHRHRPARSASAAARATRALASSKIGLVLGAAAKRRRPAGRRWRRRPAPHSATSGRAGGAGSCRSTFRESLIAERTTAELTRQASIEHRLGLERGNRTAGV